MKKLFLLLFVALASYLNLSAQLTPVTFTPVVSDETTEHWYFIQCSARNTEAPDAKWLTATNTDGDTLKIKEFTGGDEQRWKMVPNGTGFALQNKSFGTYMNSDLRYTTDPLTELVAVETMPTTALQFIESLQVASAICIADVDATVTNGDYVASSISFIPYAAAASAHYNLIVYNTNMYFPSSFIFLESIAKGELGIEINTAIEFVNTANIGADPGQYSTEDMELLSELIEEIKEAYNDPSSTEDDYIQNKNDLITVVALVKENMIMPQMSNETQDFWYFIKSTRVSTAPYVTSTGEGAEIKWQALKDDDTQLWKLVVNGDGDGFALQNKATLEYVQTDATVVGDFFMTGSTLPTKGLKFDLTTLKLDGAPLFYIGNTGDFEFRFRADGSTKINASTNGDIWASWSLVSYATGQRNTLKTKLTEASEIAASIQVGEATGQVPATAMDEFQASIDAAQVVANDNMLSSDEYVAAMTSLETAQEVLKSNAILPVISTEEQSVWYTLSGTRPAVTSVIANVSTTDSLQFQVLKQEDRELWRFVENPNTGSGNGFAIQNKETSQYIACDSADMHYLVVQSEMPTRPLKFVVSDEVSTGNFRFFIENDTTEGAPASFRLHASNSIPKNYVGNIDDNCTWAIADNSQTVRNLFLGAIDEAQVLFDLSANIIGSEYGKYPEDIRTSFATVLTAAKALDVAALDYNQLQTEYQTFSDAYAVFKNSRVEDISQLMSTEEAPKWFFITGNDPYGTDAYNKRVSINTDSNTSSTYVFAGQNIDDADSLQMWRFETAVNENEFYIINAKTDYYLSVGDPITDTYTLGMHGNGFSVAFALVNGTTNYLFCKRSSATLYYLSSWYNNVGNSNTAWRIDAVPLNTGVKDIVAPQLNIRSTNGVITVDGVENFEVYSIMGQKMNQYAALNRGVYIVKVGKITQKCIVR